MKTVVLLTLLLSLFLMGCGGDDGGSDTVAPELNSFVVSTGARFTLDPAVTVSVIASDNEGVTGLRVGETADLSGAAWVGFTSDAAYTLTTGDGVKTVYVQVKDDAGNVSAILSQYITLAENTTVACLEPDLLDLHNGSTSTLDLMIYNANDMVSGQFTVTYDPSFVQVDDIHIDATSQILASTGASIEISDRRIDNTTGQLVIGVLGRQDGFQGVTGDGPFASIDFTVIAEPTGAVNVDVSGTGYHHVPSATPVQSTLFMFGCTVR